MMKIYKERMDDMENNNVNILDDSYNRMMSFAKHHKPHGGLSNMYVLRTVDENNNTTNECYGMNMFTDNGMSKFFIDKSAFPTKLYVGNGATSFTYTSKTLVNKIAYVEDPATVTNSSKSYEYPMYYDPALGDDENGIITCVMKHMTCQFPSNITNVTDPIVITEYGIGDSIDSLWTHSWVYNLKGEKTTITKNINEKLVIDVYLCFSYYEYLITSGWAQNRYTIITTMERFMSRMLEDYIYTYKRNNIAAKRDYNQRTNSKFENNAITFTTPLKEFTMYAGPDATAGYFDGFVQWSSGFMTLEPQSLDTPENIELGGYTSLVPTRYTGFTDKFGDAYYTPITQLEATSVAMYNYKGTGDDRWNNYDDFFSDKNHSFCETPMQTVFATPIYYSNNNTVVKMYVYQNINTDDDIIGIDSTISTVYATNKYWDVSSWVNIKDFNNIPDEVKNARYWITSSNTVSINPIRKSKGFYLCMKGTNDHGYVSYSEFAQKYGARSQCDNFEYNWYMHDNVVYKVTDTSRVSYTIGDSGALATESMTYGKWLITFNSMNNFYAVNMGLDAVTPETVTPTFTTAVNLLSGCYRTKTDTGFICIQSLSGNESVILDLRNDAISQKVLQSKMSCAIYNTKQIAYISTDDTPKVCIYDMTVDSDISMKFDIPSTITNVTMMIAHTNYIWITDGTSSYVMNINTGETTTCSTALPFKSNINRMKITAVDDALFVYDYGDTNISNAYYIRLDQITDPMNASKFNPNVSYAGQRIDFNLRYIQKSDDAATLVLLIDRGYQASSSKSAGSLNIVVDFGRFLVDNVVVKQQEYSDELSCYVLYGEYFIYKTTMRCPIMNWMPHKIIGTTKTITAMKNIKHVSGKLWEVAVTNIPMFGTGETDGMPPGKQN